MDNAMTHSNLVSLLSVLTPDMFTFSVDWTGTADVRVSVRRAGWPVWRQYSATVLVSGSGFLFNRHTTDTTELLCDLNRMFDLVETV